MHVRRAVITAAGLDDHQLPLQRLIDCDGRPKTAIQIVVEEAVAAGAEDVAIVVRPGAEHVFREAAGTSPSRLKIISQDHPRGYGDAVARAREFVGDEPFLHFVGDHLYVSDAPRRCAEQLVAVAKAEECSVSAVQATRENLLPYFGAVGGKRLSNCTGLYEIDTVLEKPTPTLAEQELVVPGLRAGHYLCFFGVHVLTPTVFDLLERLREGGARQLTPALAELAVRERYLAFEVTGRRYNLGQTYGLLVSQLALGLAGDNRSEILAQIVDLLAKQPVRQG